MSGQDKTGTAIPHGINLPSRNGLFMDGIVTIPARFIDMTISYTDSAKALATIPDGAKIYSIQILATTGFNGTTPTYDLGYAADADAILDGNALPATAGIQAGTPPTATAAQWNGVTSGKLIGTFAGGGSNTTGSAILRIAYYV